MSGCSNHWSKHLDIALNVPLNFFHQKYCTPGSWPILSFLDCLVQFLFGDCEFLHIRNFLSYFLRKRVNSFLMCGFGVAFGDSLPEIFKFFHLTYLTFQLLRSLCLSIEHSSVFLKHFVITYPCFFDLHAFRLYVKVS